MAKEKIKLGIAGEFLVASKLSALGYIVAPTFKNTKGIDLLVSNGCDAKNVQVKTTQTGKPVWVCQFLKTWHKNLVYVFVCMDSDGKLPKSFHVVPSKAVAAYQEAERQKYTESNPDKQPDTIHGVWHFCDPQYKYKDNWGVFGKPL